MAESTTQNIVGITWNYRVFVNGEDTAAFAYVGRASRQGKPKVLKIERTKREPFCKESYSVYYEGGTMTKIYNPHEVFYEPEST